jgi:hypothetical protein
MEPGKARRSWTSGAPAPLLAGLLIGALIAVVVLPRRALHVPGPVQRLTIDSRIPNGACPTGLHPDSIKCEVNAIRRANGLPQLRTSYRLRLAANRHARDMVQRRYFAHISPNGASVESRVRRAGFLGRARDWGIGEDLGWGTGSRGTPQAVVAAWMRSPPHRAVILNPRYQQGGAGIARGTPSGPGGGVTYVMDLGYRSGRASAAGWEDRSQ